MPAIVRDAFVRHYIAISAATNPDDPFLDGVRLAPDVDGADYALFKRRLAEWIETQFHNMLDSSTPAVDSRLMPSRGVYGT